MGIPVNLNEQLFYVNIQAPLSTADPSVRLYVGQTDELYSDNTLALTLEPSQGDNQAYHQFMENGTNFLKGVGMV